MHPSPILATAALTACASLPDDQASEVDDIALGRESLQGPQPQIPGSRILDGYFHAAGTAIAVPKNHAAALAYVTQFIEEAKFSGIVRRALDGAGMHGAPVEPPSTK